MTTLSETPRPSIVAGRFYPDRADTLREELTSFLALKSPVTAEFAPDDVVAVMVPHAGYMFSGGIAGQTLSRITLPDRVVVLGPNHTGRGAPLSLWKGGPWQSPLGGMGIDADIREALLKADVGFMPDIEAHAAEHSIEVLVPFFQMMNPGTNFVPMVVSSMRLEALKRAGKTLARVIAEGRTSNHQPLLVISSDMSHYLPHDMAVQKDSVALEALATLDPEHYFEVVRKNKITMCGLYPMTLALYALAHLEATTVHCIAYATSGQTGRALGADMDRVVGYAGVVITR